MMERDYTPDKAYQNEEDKVKEEKLTEIFLYISF
jgi:hypothetical protein